jgi:hypothetical protein
MLRLSPSVGLWGAQRDVVALSASYAANSAVVDPTDAVAQFQLQSDGDVAKTNTNNAIVDVGDWIAPIANAGNYECFATLDSGTLTSGTTGSWLALTSSQIWSRNRMTIGTDVAQITVQIRRVGTTDILATSVVTLTAIVEPGG